MNSRRPRAPGPPAAAILDRLDRSAFRRRFRLREKEQHYIREKGMAVIRDHARAFVTERLAPARPKNDGRQTPMKNHPVFIAQHATATCCRQCLARWHGIARGKQLSPDQITYIVEVVMAWIHSRLPEREQKICC